MVKKLFTYIFIYTLLVGCDTQNVLTNDDLTGNECESDCFLEISVAIIFLASFSFAIVIARFPLPVPISSKLFALGCCFNISIINSESNRGINTCLLTKKSLP